MDSADLQKNYMDGYTKLMEAYGESGIQQTVDAINQAIRDSDSERIRECLLRIQYWNQKVMDLEDIHVSLKAKLKHLRLPSSGMLTVLYDDVTRQWRFNTEAD